MPQPVAVVPIRSFKGMRRLSDTLDDVSRSRLSQALASGVLAATSTAGLRAVVITSDRDVANWAREHEAAVCEDPGTGLSGAVHAGVSTMKGAPWIVIHADLPLVTSDAIAVVADASQAATVLVPSYDGGTTVIASRGTFPFSYGAGSFQRHYASAPNATIISSPDLSIDIDTPRHLASFLDLVEA